MKNQLCIFCNGDCIGACKMGFNSKQETFNCGGQGCNCGNIVTGVTSDIVTIDLNK